MPPKKKKGGKKKAAGEDGEVEYVEEFKKYYKNNKKNYEFESCQHKQMDNLIDEEALDDGELKELYLYANFRPEGIRCIMQSFIDSKFPQLKEIRIWKCQAYNEGARMVCQFLEKNFSQVTMCDMMGCEFFGKMLRPGGNDSLKVLKLDHNAIGWKGLAQLSRGLSQNANLNQLSLDYCDIDHRGGKYLQQIIAFIDSSITILSLQGNKLMEKGVFQLFRALEVNEVLKTVNIADNQFGESDPDLIKQMCKTFITPNACGSYDLRYNGIDEIAMREFFNAWNNEQSPVYNCLVSLSRISNPEIASMHKEIQKAHKARSKKKKKGGKKGKKGKKKKKKK